MRFKIQIVIKSKLTLEKCVFQSVTFLFLFFLLISKERELYEYKSNLRISFHCQASNSGVVKFRFYRGPWDISDSLFKDCVFVLSPLKYIGALDLLRVNSLI